MQLSPHSASQNTYTDLNRLNRLKVGEDRDSEANIKQVAREFESLFISEMMKAMRSANDVLADDLFNSNESKTYRDMYDQQMALTLSEGKGMGMADVLVRQMSNMQKGKVRPNPFADKQIELAAATEKAGKPAPEAVPVPAAKEQAEAAKFVHVADTAALKFRRFTGIMPAHLSAKARAAAKAVTELAGQPAADAKVQARGKGAEKVAASPAIQSYNAVKNAVVQGTQQVGQVVRDVFRTPAEFVETMLPMAEQAARTLGVDPKYLVAQAALETGWGKHMPRDAQGQVSRNLFGIKSHGWGGKSTTAPTTEFINGKEVRIRDSFRSYDSFAQSFNDYVDFLHRNQRYSKALQVTGDADRYVRELQRAGYATDPEYAAKISRIARQIAQQESRLQAQNDAAGMKDQV